MRAVRFTIFILLLSFFRIDAEPVIFKKDNGQSGGVYSNPAQVSWEETCMLKPDGPCKVNKVQVYLDGTQANLDTIWVVGDPAEGSYPPSLFVHYINYLMNPVVINYQGQPGWYEIDVSDQNIYADGLSAIVVQHIIKPGGPYFVIDNDEQAPPYNSFLNNVFTPNPDFYNIAGTLASLAGGNYLVRLEVEYLFPDGEGTAPPPEPQFPDVTEAAGLTDLDGSPLKAVMASAVDWNNDGFDDIAVGSRFYQNNGDGTFSDKTGDISIQASGTIWADIDNDGYIDCFAARGNGNDKIHWGNEDGSFTEDTDPVVALDQPTVSPMWLDYDHDGLLDLFIAYGRRTVNNNEVYFPDQLFRNLGNRKFENVTASAGIAAGEPSPYYDCWGASICDFNRDGWPDIFVATYRLAPDLLYRNNGDGTFTEVGQVTEARGIPTYYAEYFGHGMGSDWGDYDNDGDVDLAVGNLAHWDSRGLASNPSVILENTGAQANYKFVNKTFEMGLKFFEMNAGILWGDWDNDGLLDLFHCQYSYNKKGDDVDRDSRIYFNSGPQNNYRLIDRTWEMGCLIHGAWCPIRTDYDNDGDLDIIVASSNEKLKLFRNDIKNTGNWVGFRLKGNPDYNVSNNAFGAWVTLYSGNDSYHRSLPGTVLNGRASQSTNAIHFGLGNKTIIDSVVVDYPDGSSFTYTDIGVNNYYNLEYIGTSDIVEFDPSEAGTFNLSNCTPNPVHETGTIEFSIPSYSHTVLSLYNSAGIKVLDLVSEMLTQGQYKYELDPGNLVSGQYYYVLRSGKSISTKPVTIIK